MVGFNKGFKKKHDIPEIDRLSSLIPNKDDTFISKVEEVKEFESPMKQIFNNKIILVNVLCMIMVWISCSFCLYMISYQIKYLKGNIWID